MRLYINMLHRVIPRIYLSYMDKMYNVLNRTKIELKIGTEILDNIIKRNILSSYWGYFISSIYTSI